VSPVLHLKPKEINKRFSNRQYKKESLPSRGRAKATASGAAGVDPGKSLPCKCCMGQSLEATAGRELTLEKGVRICQAKKVNQNGLRLMKGWAETLRRALKWKGNLSLLCWETVKGHIRYTCLGKPLLCPAFGKRWKNSYRLHCDYIV